eukprot:UN05527
MGILSLFDGGSEGATTPVSSNNPSIPLVEGRPYLFLPATMPEGRQCCAKLESVACYKRSRRTKWSVPGVGDDCIHCGTDVDPIAFSVLCLGSFTIP